MVGFVPLYTYGDPQSGKRHFSHKNQSLEIVEIKNWVLEEKNSGAEEIAEGQSSE